MAWRFHGEAMPCRPRGVFSSETLSSVGGQPRRAQGALVGAVVGRTLVAMATTIVGVLGVRYLISEYVRPYRFTPLRWSSPFHLQLTATGVEATIGPPQSNDLVVSNQITTGSGRVVGQNGVIGPNGNADVAIVNGHGAAVFTGVGRCPHRIPESAGDACRPPALHRQLPTA
jgi:hypothetical protein